MSNLYLPGRKWLEVEMDLKVPRPRMRGWYKLEAVKADGSGRRRVLADWFPNVITDTGLNRIGTNSIWSYIHVGTSSTAPDTSQSALLGWVASTNSSPFAVVISAGNVDYFGDYYGYRQDVWRFNPGQATGTLAEVGLSGAASNTNLWSRALILDGAGAPTTVTVLADEYLDVTYRLELYADYTSVDGTQSGVSITGVGTRDVTIRAAEIGDATFWANGIGSSVTASTSGLAVYTGSLGAITGRPSGTSATITSPTNATYSNNSLERAMSGTFGLGSANFTHKSIRFSWNYGSYQMEFDTGITKTSTQTMAYTGKISWGRY